MYPSSRSFLLLAALVSSVCVVAGLVSLPARAQSSGPHRLIAGRQSLLSAKMVRRLSAGATDRSIIIFKDQTPSLPAQGAVAQQRLVETNVAQASVLSELQQVHAADIHSFNIINAISATISPAEVQRLRADPSVSAVEPDVFRPFATLHGGTDGNTGPTLLPKPGRMHKSLRASSVPQPICPSNPAEPLIEPEARQVMNVAAAQQSVDGSGIKVGIIGDGIDPNNPDLIRPNGQHVIFDYQDFSGFGPAAPTDGREAFLAAGAIGSQGNQTYDLSGYVNPAHPLPAGCNIKIAGIAPGASLAVLDVAGSDSGAFNSRIIQAIQWAVMKDHVDVLNESFGENPIPDTQNDPVALADQAAVAAGVTVVVGNGDNGPFNDIGSPATAQGVIAVGGTTTYRLYRQTTRFGTQLSPGGWEDNNITALSSSGVTQFRPDTVDVVAPGDSEWALCSNNTSEFQGCADPDHGANPPAIWAAAGTTASAPETSATAALVIEAYANTHKGTLPSPSLVKRIIVSTATDLDVPADHQGAGLVNAGKAVQLAESIGTSSRQGSTLLLRGAALNATVNSGQTATFHVGVTNEGAASQTITPSISGQPTTLSSDTGSVSLSNASPTYIDGEGNTDYYAEHTFAVPAGVDNLNGNITWNDQAIGGAAFETLFDPAGNVAAYSLLGGNGSGFGHVEVHNPLQGVWTAVLFTVSNAPYFGPVQFSYSTEAFHDAGSVSPAHLTLAPGKFGVFQVSVTPRQAGDHAFSLRMGTGGSADGSVPIVIRTLVPLQSGSGTFSGTLTGGGANFNAGQSTTYQFRVPPGRASLNVATNMSDNNYRLEGFLVNPFGEPVDAQSNALFDANDNLQGFGRSMQFFRNAPAAGVWTLILLDAGPGDGAHLSEPFSGTISFTWPSVRSSNIPNSPSKVLPAGKSVSATVTITNTGAVRKDFFVDARLDGRVTQQLRGNDANNVSLPLSSGSRPNWLIPPGSTKLTVTGQGTVPITMDVAWAFGDPDVLGVSSGNRSVATLTAPEIAPGLFYGSPDATGPFATATGGTVNLTATANTYPFDPAVSASSGDVWQSSVKSNAAYTPLSLGGGQKGVISVTFTPNAPKGRVIRGFLSVDTFNPTTFSGDDLRTIQYTYKVG